MRQHEWIKRIAAAAIASAVAGLVGQASHAALPEAARATDTIPRVSGNLNTPAFRQAFGDIALRRGTEAKQARNAVIARWLGRLHEAGLAEFSVLHLDKGLIYSVRLKGGEGFGELSALWVAVPDGPDLPSAVLLKTGETPVTGEQAVLELQSCSGSETLDVAPGPVAPGDAEAQAVSRLNDYLDAPDPMAITTMGGARYACSQLAQMLPSPRR